MTYATYFESFDVKELLEQFPLDQAFTDKFKNISREELRAEQNAMFLRCVARAWQIPFYQRLWGNAGIKPEDIQSLDDLDTAPSKRRRALKMGRLAAQKCASPRSGILGQ